MERYVDYFRIKLILIAAIIVLPIVFIITLAGVWEEDLDDSAPSIKFENAPENTAYVDILVKLPESSKDYVDFAEWDNPPQTLVGYEDIAITPDSEIAKLNDDGYVSLSVHYRNSKGFSKTGIQLDDAITDINERFGKFKAAYVDNCGNVLNITKASRTRFDPKNPSGFILNGDALTFRRSSLSPLQIILLSVSLIGEPLAVIALIVCIVLSRLQNKYMNSRQ